MENLPSGNLYIPNDTCSRPLTYFSSKSKYLATANTCLKAKSCSQATTYNDLV